jgi:hypothetical protein
MRLDQFLNAAADARDSAPNSAVPATVREGSRRELNARRAAGPRATRSRDERAYTYLGPATAGADSAAFFLHEVEVYSLLSTT